MGKIIGKKLVQHMPLGKPIKAEKLLVISNMGHLTMRRASASLKSVEGKFGLIHDKKLGTWTRPVV